MQDRFLVLKPAEPDGKGAEHGPVPLIRNSGPEGPATQKNHSAGLQPDRMIL
jgi:hypothetical protein